MDAIEADLRPEHVIVVANEKGGAGKSTVSIHLAVAILHRGHSVATIDLDSRQLSMARMWENRRAYARDHAVDVPHPQSFSVARGGHGTIEENEIAEFAAFADVIGKLEGAVDFILIDTPATDSYLMRLAHSIADTLVTPVNDSFVDVDVIARVDALRTGRVASSQYAEIVAEARRKRRIVDGGEIDWVVVRNRTAQLGTANERAVARSLERASDALRFRAADGFEERVVYRELYPFGLTVLDVVADERLGLPTSAAREAAAEEVERLIDTLDLPVREEAAPGADADESRLDARLAWLRRRRA